MPVEDAGSAPPPNLSFRQGVQAWVPGFAALGLALFLMQLPTFGSSFEDAKIRERALRAWDHGEYKSSAELFKDLSARYPKSRDFSVKLLTAQYRSNDPDAALETYDRLVGVRLNRTDSKDVMEIMDNINNGVKYKPSKGK
ncbi:MAG: hypothetical protein HY286_02730 [Planctomycetes bacterium]|nr:hypothetical protein [Planctomycetota bacterium]